MAVPRDTIWEIEPHTVAKHEILKLYLQRWFRILSKDYGELIYIDGFCGPGRYTGGEPGSPLVALDVAKPVSGRVEKILFLFTDERLDRIQHLEGELADIQIPKNFRASPKHMQFAERLEKVLDHFDSQPMPPSFVFIDPFGFAGVPYSLIRRTLNKPRCETLITFMIDAVNRFLDHPDEKLRGHMGEIFGTDECFQILGEDRIQRLRDLYQRQLQKAARFVRYFEMYDRRGRLIYLLFFASNNRMGHLKMKEAMWSVDPLGEFKFSDRTSSQAVLFHSDEASLAWSLMHRRFRAQTVDVDEVLLFVEDETAFLAKHMRAALAEHENLFRPDVDWITVAELKADGSKRRKGTFASGSIITFPK